MKKIVFAIALLMMGGASLSTASAASLSPAVANITETVRAESGVELTGGRGHGHKHKHFRKKFHKGFYKGKGYGYYPYGYYKGFCYAKPYHWWCKKHYFKKY